MKFIIHRDCMLGEDREKILRPVERAFIWPFQGRGSYPQVTGGQGGMTSPSSSKPPCSRNTLVPSEQPMSYCTRPHKEPVVSEP
jgi:hypothetical protein